ncbi:hypothetical protein BC832DRAFT_614104 [Gaertneriomyces semiglobifer]|nr:hypothetical protein BC832DRAFT_614104 [Gaertneriomyces semiglobifer]
MSDMSATPCVALAISSTLPNGSSEGDLYLYVCAIDGFRKFLFSSTNHMVLFASKAACRRAATRILKDVSPKLKVFMDEKHSSSAADDDDALPMRDPYALEPTHTLFLSRKEIGNLKSVEKIMTSMFGHLTTQCTLRGSLATFVDASSASAAAMQLANTTNVIHYYHRGNLPVIPLTDQTQMAIVELRNPVKHLSALPDFLQLFPKFVRLLVGRNVETDALAVFALFQNVDAAIVAYDYIKQNTALDPVPAWYSQVQRWFPSHSKVQGVESETIHVALPVSLSSEAMRKLLSYLEGLQDVEKEKSTTATGAVTCYTIRFHSKESAREAIEYLVQGTNFVCTYRIRGTCPKTCQNVHSDRSTGSDILPVPVAAVHKQTDVVFPKASDEELPSESQPLPANNKNGHVSAAVHNGVTTKSDASAMSTASEPRLKTSHTSGVVLTASGSTTLEGRANGDTRSEPDAGSAGVHGDINSKHIAVSKPPAADIVAMDLNKNRQGASRNRGEAPENVLLQHAVAAKPHASEIVESRPPQQAIDSKQGMKPIVVRGEESVSGKNGASTTLSNNLYAPSAESGANATIDKVAQVQQTWKRKDRGPDQGGRLKVLRFTGKLGGRDTGGFLYAILRSFEGFIELRNMATSHSTGSVTYEAYFDNTTLLENAVRALSALCDDELQWEQVDDLARSELSSSPSVDGGTLRKERT